MATPLQILANRENAKRSTGPKTEAGKSKSSMNATVHGFYSKAFVVRDTERADFEELRDKLLAEYDPVDTTSEDFFQEILHASWNLFRLRGMENKIYAESDDPFGDEKTLRKLDALRRHKGHFQRALRSARKAFAEHMTGLLNLSTIPSDIRQHFRPSIDTRSFLRAHHDKWKVYRPEDYVTQEQLDAARAEDQLRRAVTKPTQDQQRATCLV